MQSASRDINDNLMGPLAQALWAVAQGKMQNDAANRQGEREMARFDWNQTKEEQDRAIATQERAKGDQERAKSDFANAIHLAAQGVAAPGYEGNPQVQKMLEQASQHQSRQTSRGALEDALLQTQVDVGKNKATWDSPLMRSLRGVGTTVSDWGSKVLSHKAPAETNASTGWHKDQGGTWFRSNKDGSVDWLDPETKKVTRTDAKGNPLDEPASATAPGPAQGPQGSNDSWWTARRSGKAGVSTLGDLMGGIVDGWDVPLEERVRANPESFGLSPTAPAAAPAQQQPQPPAFAPVTLNGIPTVDPATLSANPVIPDPGYDAWHNLAVQNPNEFARQAKDIQAKDPQRFAAIVQQVRLRRMRDLNAQP